MLILAVGGVWFYSIRKTNQLFDIGLNDHLRCAIAGTYPRRAEMAEGLGVPFAPMLQPLMDAAGLNDVVSAHHCTVEGRQYTHIILRPGQTLVSVILTRRGDQEIFPRALAGRVIHVAGISLHEGTRGGYPVAAFESGDWLAYVVSALPGPQNDELARRVAPVIDRYTKV
jgi:hypothetical protein